MKSDFYKNYEMTKPEYIDTHAHLYFEDYDDDRDEVIKRCKDNKVAVINIGTDLESSKKALKLAEENENFYAVIGFHPIYVKDAEAEDIKEFEKLITHPKCVGIGECGLDYSVTPKETKADGVAKPVFVKDYDVAKQKEFFIRQIGFALDYNKPLVIHCRDSQNQTVSKADGAGSAWSDVLDILKTYKEINPDLKVNFHFFNQDKKLAKEILDLGFQFSFTGVITFVKELEEVVKFAPIDKLMSETDSPYVSPKSKRGKKNEPSHVIEIVEKIAELKGLDVEEVKNQLIRNAEEFFGL